MDFMELLSRISGGQAPALQAQPQAPQPDPTGAPAGPVPATTAPAAPAAPPAAPGGAPAGSSPQDLSAMYMKLMDRQRADADINRGMTLLAAGFARPESRSNLISMASGAGGSSSDTNAGSIIGNLQKFQQLQQAQAVRAAQLARLPAIAKQYGLDMETVKFLFESGKLDETINTLAKPDNEFVKAPDGSASLLDRRTGNTIKPNVVAGDPQHGFTTDQKELAQINRERAARGEAPISAESHFEGQAGRRGGVAFGEKTAAVAAGKAIEGLSKSEEAAQNSVTSIDRINGARDTLAKGIISGSPIAEKTLAARKTLASVFGIKDDDAANTDVFTAKMREIVLPRVKALGTGNSISNADRDFIEKGVGGSLDITPEGAMEILNALERLERDEIEKHNDRYEEFAKVDPGAAKYMRRLQQPEARHIPPEAGAFLKQNPTEENIAAFQRKYGRGTHRRYMEAN